MNLLKNDSYIKHTSNITYTNIQHTQTYKIWTRFTIKIIKFCTFWFWGWKFCCNFQYHHRVCIPRAEVLIKFGQRSKMFCYWLTNQEAQLNFSKISSFQPNRKRQQITQTAFHFHPNTVFSAHSFGVTYIEECIEYPRCQYIFLYS